MGMAQNMGGANAANLFSMGQQQAQQAPQQPQQVSAPDSWTCACGTANTGKFCIECGKPKPEQTGGWTCACGAVNTGKFCTECGKPKPAAAVYKCDKCGWVPDDPSNPPKFCPQCGDAFDDNDRQ